MKAKQIPEIQLLALRSQIVAEVMEEDPESLDVVPVVVTLMTNIMDADVPFCPKGNPICKKI